MPTHYKGKTGKAREIALEEHEAAKGMPYTPFKMKGSPMQRNFGIGASPAKQPDSGAFARKFGIPNLNVPTDIYEHGIKFEGGKGKTTTSIKPHIKIGDKLSLGTSFTGQRGSDDPTKSTLGSLMPVDPLKPVGTETSLTGKLDLSGKGGRHGKHTGFQGSLSGNIGARDLYHRKAPKRGKLTYGGKVEAGLGTKRKNVKLFGEYGSKYSLSGGGPKVGISGKYGMFKGSAGYNLKTKKPEFGLSIDI